MIVLAVTGHRPPKLGGYDNEENFRKLVDYFVKIIREVKPDKGITGMALGVDQAFAFACLEEQVPFIVAVPFHGQERRWPRSSQKRYEYLLSRAESVKYVHDGPVEARLIPKYMQDRNIWMVDHCTHLAGVHDGSTGGTFNCLNYAHTKLGDSEHQLRALIVTSPKAIFEPTEDDAYDEDGYLENVAEARFMQEASEDGLPTFE